MNIYTDMKEKNLVPTGEFRVPKPKEWYISISEEIQRSPSTCIHPRIILKYIEDKDHPPVGYRLVTDEDRKCGKEQACKILKFWSQALKQWETCSDGGGWYSQDVYAVPEDFVFEPKTVKMTVAQIQEKLGHKIEVVEG
jgi:hypothetical protein